MKGKLHLQSCDEGSSSYCSGRYSFTINAGDKGEDPWLEGVVIDVDIPDKPKWKGKQVGVAKEEK